MIAGTSASIEPLFALAYCRHALDGQTLTELNPIFVQVAKRDGFYSDDPVRALHRQGSLTQLADVPPAAKRLFQTALEIAPQDHLRIQTAFQKYVEVLAGVLASTGITFYRTPTNHDETLPS